MFPCALDWSVGKKDRTFCPQKQHSTNSQGLPSELDEAEPTSKVAVDPG